MDDVRTWLSSVDTLEPPEELWSIASTRAGRMPSPSGSRRGTRSRPPGVPSGWRRAVIVVAAFVVFAAAMAFAWNIVDQATSDPADPPPSIGPNVDPFSGLAPGWTQLADPPEIRCCAATAWTGSELLVWGGHVGQAFRSESTGWIYDPLDDTWSEMPKAPLDARSQPAGVWTGRELLVWGGASTNTQSRELFDDGAAFDPSTETWRTLPPAPIGGREPFAVWTGDEMLVWGSQGRDERGVDGAAYDPLSDTWRRIADGPAELTDATAVWTGEEMIVFGAALHGGSVPETNTAIAIAYDPATDSWRRLPDSDLDTNANDAVWIGQGLLAWDYNLDSQIYDPAPDRWTDAGSVPTDECEDVPTTVWAGAAYGTLCGDLVTFDPDRDAWRPIGQPLSTSQFFDYQQLYGAGGTLLVAGDLDPFGEGEQWRMYAYLDPRAGVSTVEPLDPFPIQPYASKGMSRLYLVFPEGGIASIEFPRSLDLAEWGVEGIQPDMSYVKDGTHRFLFLHGLPGVEVPYLEGPGPVAEFETDSGVLASVWSADLTDIDNLFDDGRFWVVFRTPRWSVLAVVPDVEDARTLVEAIDVTEEGGFPVVSARDPVKLASSYGDGGGAQLSLGDAHPQPNVKVLGPDDRVIDLSPDGCFGPDQVQQGFASVCLGEGVAMHVSGDPEFVQAVVDGFQLEYFQPARS